MPRTTDDPALAHILDLLAPWAQVSARRLFGGWGLYRGALMFALIADDVLYFKCGANLRLAAGERELTLFSYTRTTKPAKASEKAEAKKEAPGKTPPKAAGRVVSLGYAQVPADVLEESEWLSFWAEAAYNDALLARRGQSRNAQPSKPKKRKR